MNIEKTETGFDTVVVELEAPAPVELEGLDTAVVELEVHVPVELEGLDTAVVELEAPVAVELEGLDTVVVVLEAPAAVELEGLDTADEWLQLSGQMVCSRVPVVKLVQREPMNDLGTVLEADFEVLEVEAAR